MYTHIYVVTDGDDFAFGKVWPDYPDVTVDDSLDFNEQVRVSLVLLFCVKFFTIFKEKNEWFLFI